mgnify:FL=1
MKTDGGNSTSRGVLAEFLRGATQPSLAGLIGIIVVASGLFAACLVFITPRNIARIDPGYLMTSRYDSWVVHSSTVLSLAEFGVEPGTRPVALFGTSALHHAVTSVEELGDQIEGLTDQRVRVYPLWSDALWVWDITNAIGMLPDEFPGVVVLSLSALSFCREGEGIDRLNTQPRAAYTSEQLREEMRIQGVEPRGLTGIYFLDESRFFTVRLSAVRNIVFGPRRQGRLFDGQNQLPDPTRWDRIMAAMNSRLEQYDAAHGQVFDAVGRIIDALHSRGARVVICEPPINPYAMTRMDQAVFEKHRVNMRSFASERGIEYWDLRSDVPLPEAEFNDDWTHLTKGAGREAYTAELGKRIARLLSERIEQ